ncbi:MAG: FecR family protein [Gammaproteobacteria bacterium]|nr:FecR family protein [Gammaproteobacteria bacterium]MBU1655593.1 FecR family protein [Gammaproteobacteria bacterium]MBU1961874.1 FecR family protein [Gammaproteobacteria bacterium]
MNHLRILKATLSGLLILYVPLALGGAGSVGRVDFSKGMVKALQLNEQPRILSTNGDIFLNDLVETGDHSFALLKFIDDGKTMVRPNSIFSVSKYSEERREVRLDMVKGGAVIETGRIAADHPSHMTLDTPLVQINAQQAKFKIRLCKKDCAEESIGSNANVQLSQEVIGRVVDQRGETYAGSQEVRRAEVKRPLVLGSPVYRSDYLLTGADGYLLVVFADGGRTALNANSKLLVEDYRYQEKGVKDKAFLRLVRGSLRAVSGSLGKVDHNEYSLATPVATIGIRGTAFSLLCNCGCGADAAAKPGLFGRVRQGAIQLENGAGSQLLGEGQSAYIPGWQGKIEVLSVAPAGLADGAGPPQEEKAVDMAALFGKEELQGIPPGLYLTVEDGFLRLTGKEGEGRGVALDLGRNEAAFVDVNGKMTRLASPKGFQLKDESPVPPRSVK